MSRGRILTGTKPGYPVKLARDGVVTSDGRIIRLGKKHATKIKRRRPQ